MTDDEKLGAARARCRDFAGPGWVDLREAGDAVLADLLALARSDLRSHPADDGDAVTAEWLESQGWWVASSRTVAAFEAGDLRVSGQLRDGVWHLFGRRVEGDCSLRCHTRGHVRRLRAALGVTPGEG